MNNKLNKLFNPALTVLLLALAAIFPFAARAQQTKDAESKPEIVASGGNFTLEKAVLAGGGNGKQFSTTGENGTTGQPVAGVRSTAGGFALYSGFWTPDNFIPTAANVTVGGRILTANGLGIRNVQVTILFPSGETRTTLSSSFGYYRFADIPAGGVYVVSVAAKKYAFSNATQIRQVVDELLDVDFVADAG